METRHPVKGQFVANFLQSEIIAELWRPEVARPDNFVSNCCIFLKKTTHCGKIFKLLSQTFLPPHRLTVCVQLSQNLSDGKSAKSCVIYYTQKNFGWLTNCRYCADRAQNLPGPDLTFGSHCSRFHPNRFFLINTVILPEEYFHDSPEAKHRFGRIIKPRWSAADCLRCNITN